MQGREENVYYDYVDGVGEHGPVLQKFSAILEDYKQCYSKWKPFQDENLQERAEILVDKPKSMMIASVVMFVIALILYPGDGLSFSKGFIYFLFSLIAGYFIQFKYNEEGWAVALPMTTFVLMVVGAMYKIRIYWWFLLFCFAVYGGRAWWMRKKDNERYEVIHSQNLQQVKEQKEVEEYLKTRKQQLQKLLPELREEYENLRRQLLRVSENSLSESERYKELPKVFWWEVLPDKLYAIEQELWKARNESYNCTWETKAINRTQSKEYGDAADEFSPLYPGQRKIDYDRKRTECRENGGMVIDFVSLVLSSFSATETIKFTEYRYGALERFSKSMEWNAIGRDIENSYRDGDLLEKDYKELRNRYSDMNLDVYNKIHEEVQNSYTRDKEVRTATHFWEGQMLLFPEEGVKNEYILEDYRCRFENLYENINALEGYNITRVKGDIAERNPVVLAKIHQIFPDCR